MTQNNQSMKKDYKKLSVTRIEFEAENDILLGSATLQSISLQNVKVEEFAEDSDFPSGGFDVNFD